MKKIITILLLISSSFLNTAFADDFYSIGHVQSIFHNTSNAGTWQQVYRTNPLRDFMCSPDALCLAVGDHGALFYNETKNSDASSLVPVQPTGLTNSNQLMLQAVTFADTTTNPNGIFVIAGSQLINGASKPFLASSTDRVHWQIADLNLPTPASFQGINDVQWNANQKLFVAVGQQGLILRSQDGQTWFTQKSVSTDNLMSVYTSTDGDYAIPATSNSQPAYLLPSQDGRTWNKQMIPGDTYPTVGLIFDSYKKYYVLANSNGQFFTTQTLANAQWTSLTLPALPTPTQTPITAFGTYIDGDSSQDSFGYVVGQSDGKMYVTTNNLSQWKFVQAQAHSTITKYKRVFGLSDFYFTANGVYGDAGAGDVEMNGLNSMVHANNVYIAVGSGDGIVKSNDGIHWQAEAVSSIDNDLGGLDFTGVTFAQNKFYAVGTHYLASTDTNTGVLLSSEDGNHWTLVKQWPNTVFSNIVFHNNTFYLLASDLNLLTSIDAQNWHTQQLGIPQFGDLLETMVFGPNNTAIITSVNGDVFASTDGGKTWHQNRANAYPLLAVVWDAHLGKYVATGFDNTIAMSTPDNIANKWTSMDTNTPGDLDFISISLLGDMLYINGFNQEDIGYATYQSDTGANWTNANISNNFLQFQQFDFS